MINPVSTQSVIAQAAAASNVQKTKAGESTPEQTTGASTQPPTQTAPVKHENPQQQAPPPLVPQPSPIAEQNLYQKALTDLKDGNTASAQKILNTLQGQNPALAARLKEAFPTS